MDATSLYLKNKFIFQVIITAKDLAKQLIDCIFNLNSKFPTLLIVFNLIIIAELSLQNKTTNIFYVACINLVSLYFNKDKSLKFKIITFCLYNFVCINIIISKQMQFQLLEDLSDDTYLFKNYHEYEILVKKYELDLINNRIKGFGTIVAGNYKDLNVYFTINEICDLEVGAVLKAFAKAEFIRPETVPGGFDESKWLAQSATYFRLELNPRVNWEILYLEQGKYWFLRYIYKIRYFISSKLVEFCGTEAGGLNAAMLYGDSTFLSKKNKDLFGDLGLSHVLVASGSNVAIVLASSKGLNSKFIKHYKVRSGINIILLVFYLIISLGDISITRAIIMKVTEIFNKNRKKKINPVNYLCFSVIVMAIFNPYALLSLGLKLSFMACLAVYTFDNLINLMKDGKKESEENIWKSLCMGFLRLLFFYIYIQVFLLFFLWKPGYKISFIKLFSNIVFLPFFEIVLIWSCVFLVFVFFSIPAAVVGFVLKFCFESILLIFNNILNLELNFYLSSNLILLLSLSIIFFVVKKIVLKVNNYPNISLMSKYIFVVVLVIVFMINTFIDFQKNGVYFVDIGQGDASIIRTSGKIILIDTGAENEFNNLSLTLNYLEVRSIDYVIITHFDSDHSGAIYKILNEYKVKNIVISKFIKSDKEVIKLSNYISDNNLKTEFCFVNADDQIKIKDLVVYFLSPNKKYQERNQGSLCFYTYLKSKTILWTGDIDFEIEKSLIARNNLHPVQFLHVPHHGSKYGSSDELIKKLSPQVAIISAGLKNRYGHPTPEVIKRLHKYSSNLTVYRTDAMGTIYLPKSWEKKVRILCESKYLPENYDKIIITAKGG